MSSFDNPPTSNIPRVEEQKKKEKKRETSAFQFGKIEIQRAPQCLADAEQVRQQHFASLHLVID
jgi:hypothetical protein